MKILIILLSLMSFSVYAQEPLEPNWKVKARVLITRFAGIPWSEKILGPAPVAEIELKLPEIPKNFKSTTDVGSLTRLQKETTEYDRLPAERKRQFDFKFLQELFLITRKTEARDEDLVNWLNTLDQGGSREGIYQALVLDDVYAALENMDEKPTDRLLNFTEDFGKKFLAQRFTKESLAQFNLYTLKRTMTEKGLDLLEYYETKDLEALYQWYAAFSAYIGAPYAPLLKTEIRQASDQRYHYQWAKNMPIQHIKSEFIIKMHTVMNGLQLLK